MGAYEELVDAHAGVDGNAPAEVALELLLLHRLGRIVRQKLRQTLTKKNPHKIETKTHHESAAKTATTHTTGHKSERGRRGTPPPSRAHLDAHLASDGCGERRRRRRRRQRERSRAISSFRARPPAFAFSLPVLGPVWAKAGLGRTGLVGPRVRAGSGWNWTATQRAAHVICSLISAQLKA